MTFPYDQAATNQALSTLGSSYQLPSYAQSQDATMAAPATQNAPNFAAPAAPPPAAAPPEPEKKDPSTDWGKMAKMAGGAASAMNTGDAETDEEKAKKEGMAKLGTIIGMVGSMYTGNYAGVAQGAQSMGGGSK